MRYLRWVTVLLVCIPSWAQVPSEAPQFEVASIRPVAKNVPGSEPGLQGLREWVRDMRRPGEIPMLSPDRVLLKDWTLLDLIAAAYVIRPGQVSGPDWIAEQGFDLEATVPVSTPKSALNGMLQSLLEERFGLKAHHVLKTGKGYALIVGKDGPKLIPAAPASPPAEVLTQGDLRAQAARNLEMMMKRTPARRGRSGRFEMMPSVTMDELAARLVRYTEAPVVDATDLAGKYSVDLEVSSNDSEPGYTIFDAVEKLGLKLEHRKVTLEALVVDQASKLPTAN